MAGFNWIDIVAIMLLALAVYIGLRVGFFTLVLIFGGFFGGLFLGGWIFPHLIPIHDQTLLTLICSNLVLIFAAYAAIRGFDAGKYIHVSLGKANTRYLEAAAGVVVSVFSMLLVIWLTAAMLGRLPFAGLSNSANDAVIVQTLDRQLPPVPSIFARVDRLIDPNSPPHVYVKALPTSSLGISPLPPTNTSVKQAGNSVVRVTSFGCGSIVTGSGFAVAPNLVITDAHVIAGVKRPIIKLGTQSYETTPVLFNPSLDLAVLRVSNLKLRPLPVTASDERVGTQVYAAGFPKGNYALTGGIIRNDLPVYGPNIYGTGTFGRNIYEIEIKVNEGSSGSPVLLANGQVAGIIFAKSDLNNNYGYALTSSEFVDQIAQAKKSYKRVGTGACFAG